MSALPSPDPDRADRHLALLAAIDDPGVRFVVAALSELPQEYVFEVDWAEDCPACGGAVVITVAEVINDLLVGLARPSTVLDRAAAKGMLRPGLVAS